MDEKNNSITPQEPGDEKETGRREETPGYSQAAVSREKPQAVLDLEAAGLPAAGPRLAEARSSYFKKGKNERNKGGTLMVAARFRWIFLLILSLAAIAAWTVEAFYSGRPYKWEAIILATVSAVLTLAAAKILRLPTRGGLAAFLWSATFLFSALYGPDDVIFGNIPAALPWGGLLTMIMIWLAVAIWRKLGRYKVVDIVMAVILAYAALSPLYAVVDNLIAGYALSLRFETLNASPSFLTSHSPWFLWPMTLVVAVMLPLAVIFALWDQISILKRPGGRHGGNFFLALAFAGLMPYAFLCYDEAVSDNPGWAVAIRSVYPPASSQARETRTPETLKAADPPIAALEEQTHAGSSTELVAESAAPVQSETGPATEETTPKISSDEAVDSADEPPTPALGQQTISPSPLRPLPAEPQASDFVLSIEQRLAEAERDLAQVNARINELESKIDLLRQPYGYSEPHESISPLLPLPDPARPEKPDSPESANPTLDDTDSSYSTT
jgi:hypothetical protein